MRIIRCMTLADHSARLRGHVASVAALAKLCGDSRLGENYKIDSKLLIADADFRHQ